MIAALAKIKGDLEYRTPTTNKPMSHIAIPREQALELIEYVERLAVNGNATDGHDEVIPNLEPSEGTKPMFSAEYIDATLKDELARLNKKLAEADAALYRATIEFHDLRQRRDAVAAALATGE